MAEDTQVEPAQRESDKQSTVTAQHVKTSAIGPPESVEPSQIYKLYRGTVGEIAGDNHRVWVEFPALQLCWAKPDTPARLYDQRASLLDVSRCECGAFDRSDADGDGAPWTKLDIYQNAVAAREELNLTISIAGPVGALQDFGEALQQLVKSREVEGPKGLEFIQKRLFQYLWMHQGANRTTEELYEAEAILAFNLDPKEGVAYLKSKCNVSTEKDIGEWIALVATKKGGFDPTLLGSYFSRRDTLEVFKAFVRCIDFSSLDIVTALRKLFDTFKPGGEGQVITRILDYFSAAYFDQWQVCQETNEPVVAYKDPDTVVQVAVSIIMLNTGLHVATKKVGKKAPGAAMTIEEYIKNTRHVVDAEQVSDQALTAWYEAVRQEEIKMEPLSRAPFSKLPVQPDIEGWVIAVLSPQMQRRFWVVLALQRMYLFSDDSEVDPIDAIDLKDLVVRCVPQDSASKERFQADLYDRGRGGLCQCLAPRSNFPDFEEVAARAFEVSQQGASKPCILERSALEKKIWQPRNRLALLAESKDLMEKWVSLIAAGPY